jgi:Mg-chelatase subunit ChlD
MKKLFVVLFIFVAVGVFAQQKYALVIGNGNYTNFGSLPNALNDANDMTTALQGLGFTVDKVLDGDRTQMEGAITRLKNRLSISKNSYGFFFYAGHGLQFNGVNYLIPAKAEIPGANYLGDRAVSVQTMLAELNDAGNELNIVVLDACRDFPAAWSRSTNRGLTVVANQPADSIIVYATSAGSTAADGTGRNGLFTSQLLKNLKTPGLEVSEVFRLTGSDVARASNRQQIPAIYNQFFETAYLGTKPTATVPVQPTPAPEGVYMQETIDAFTQIAGRNTIRTTGPADMVKHIITILEKEKGSEVDIAVVLDVTRSMSPYFDAVRMLLLPILQQMTTEFKSFRIGIVFYKDYYEEFLNIVFPFTTEFSALQSNINNIKIGGGGDIPEAVIEALHAGATKLSWEATRRIMILIGDAPPHSQPRGSITKEIVDNEVAQRKIELHAIILPQ